MAEKDKQGVKTLLEVTETLQHEIKSLLGAVGVLQSLVSQAKSDYNNDQDPDGFEKGNRYLSLAQEVCMDIRGHYPPGMTPLLAGRALAVALDLRMDGLFGCEQDVPHQLGGGDPGATLESASRYLQDQAAIEMAREEDERFLQSLDEITAAYQENYVPCPVPTDPDQPWSIKCAGCGVSIDFRDNNVYTDGASYLCGRCIGVSLSCTNGE